MPITSTVAAAIRTLDTRPVVLVINASPEVRDGLEILLKREGYRVAGAADGRQGLERAQSLEPDLIICEVSLPEVNGIEVCRRLKWDVRTASVPVLLTGTVRGSGASVGGDDSDDGGQHDDVAYLEAGADGFLETPIRQQELLIKVARFAERHHVERRYRDIVEHAAEIIYTIDTAGRITSINEAGARFFNCPVPALRGRLAAELFGAPSSTDLANILARPGEGPTSSIYRVRDAQREPHYLEVVMTPVRDAAGALTGVHSIARDITERVRAEEALRESEERFRVLSESAFEAIIVHENNTIIDANQAFADMSGYDLTEVIGQSIMKFTAPGSRAKVIANIHAGHEKPYEAMAIRRDGSPFLVEVAGRRIFYRGRPVRVTVLRDISERVGVEARLGASIQQLEALTALVTAVKDANEVDCLFEGLADSITEITDYRSGLIVLLTDEPPYHPRVLSHSSNISAERIRLFTNRPYMRDEVTRVLASGVRIALGELGFAAYYPPRHDSALGCFFPERRTAAGGAPREPAEDEGHGHEEGDAAVLVPLTVREGDHIGFIWLDSPRSARAPDRQSILPVVAFARQVTQLIAQRRAARPLAQQAEREALINRITQAVRRSLDPAEVFRTAVTELGAHLGVDRCVLFMIDHAAGVMRNVAEYVTDGTGAARPEYPLTAIGEFIRSAGAHGIRVFDDAENEKVIGGVYASVLRELGTRSMMYVAVTAGNETPGAFIISTVRERRDWNKSDIALARAVADQTGIAIRQAELHQRAEATSARETLINRLSQEIRASLNLPEILHAATHEMGRALKASRVFICPFEPMRSDSPIECEYVAPDHPALTPPPVVNYDNPIGRFLKMTLRPLIIDDTRTYRDGPPDVVAEVRELAATGVLSKIFCPLIVQGRFRGTLCAVQTDRVRHWTPTELALIETVASQLTIGIAQAELFEMIVRSKQTWEATFDAMSDGVFIFDNKYHLTRVNRAGAAMEKSSPRELLGRRCCDILRTGTGDECVIEKIIREGRSITLDHDARQQGPQRTLLVTAEPVEVGAQSIGTVCTVRDLSELRKVERVARERQSLLENILESAREAIFALDPEGRYEWCNNSTILELSGYRPEEMIGRKYLEMIPENDREMVAAHFRRALSGEPQTFETRFYAGDGTVHHSLVDQAPLIIDGRITGVLGIAHDITERKQERERAAQADKLRALGQLASGVAHDFNNSLAAILGRAQLLLQRTALDPEVKRGLDIIQTAAEDAAMTVRRISTFARPSQGEEFELLNVTGLLRDAVEITRTQWENRARGLYYDVRVEAEPELYTEGTASELREVFVNLIVNAIDAMPEGGRLVIRTEHRREASDRFRLLFTDTGTGMAREVLERVFEPFYTTKGLLGTGLGLFVSYGIIERHHGQMSVASEVGRGTTFTIELPRVESAHHHSGKEHRPGAVSRTRHPLSILVVDDEPIVRDTLAEMISVLGHRVVVADSGTVALGALSAQNFDLVFTDLSMPGMNGLEVARELRRRWPAVQVVIVTGHGAEVARLTGEENGAAGVIAKPFNFAQVEETIARMREVKGG